MRYENRDLIERLAADYAVGALRGPARRRFERLMAADATIAHVVEGWSLKLDALAEAARRLEEPEATPSARVLHAMARNHMNSHVRFTLAESLSHRGTLLGIPLKPDAEDRFARLAAESLEKQRKIEAADRVDFETYRQRYLNPELLGAEALEK